MSRVSSLFVDTAAFTLSVPDNAQQRVADYLSERSHEIVPPSPPDYWRADHETEQASAPLVGFSGYQSKVRIALTAYTFARIGFGPRRGRNFLRIEYSPRKAGESGCVRLVRILEEATDNDIDALRAHMRRTRIDFAVDVYRARLDRCLLDDSRLRAGKVVHYYGAGSHETQSFGLRMHSHMTIYDKATQLRENPSARGPHPASRMRIEYSLKNTFGLEAREIEFNHFAGLRVWDVMRPECSTDWEWLHFVDACRVRGVEAALTCISDPRQRATFRRRLYHCRAAWWNPQAIWAGLDGTLAATSLIAR